MDAVTVVTTVLLHNYQVLTVPDLVQLSACCKEWREIVTVELKKQFAACKVMYNFLTAVRHCPRVVPPSPKEYKYKVHKFAEAEWERFLAALNYEMTPVQLALYYAYCFWVGVHRLSPTALWASNITLLLHPSGTVKQVLSEVMARDFDPPYIQFKKSVTGLKTSWTVTLNFSKSNIDPDKLDVWLLAAAVHTEPQLYAVLEEAQFTERDLSRLAYVMVPWQVNECKPVVSYNTSADSDTLLEKQEVSVCFPLAAGNMRIGSCES